MAAGICNVFLLLFTHVFNLNKTLPYNITLLKNIVEKRLIISLKS